MKISHYMLKNTLIQITNDLMDCLKRKIIPDKWIKVNWLHQTIEHFNHAIIELDKITSKYNALYNISLNDESYLVEKYKDIIFYSRSFFEGVFVYYKGLTDKKGLNIFSTTDFFTKFKEIGYVCKVRNFFIVHPNEFRMSFYPSVKTTPTENVLFAKFSGSHKTKEDDTKWWYREVFDKSSSHQDIVTKNESALLNIKQKILDTETKKFPVLTDEEQKYIRLKGIPNFDQNQFSNDLITLHKEIFKQLDLESLEREK